MTNITYIIDANVLIQNKSIKEIDWLKICGHSNFIIAIPTTVIKEINKLKNYSTNSRVKKRVLKINRLFRKIHDSDNRLDDLKFEFLQNALKWDALLSDFPNNHEEIKELDKEEKDDKIIVEILRYRKIHPEKRVILITEDFDLILTAEKFEIETIDSSMNPEFKQKTKPNRIIY